MIKFRKISVKQLIFKKWSRKNYAIFSTLKRIVTIGHLKIDICKQAKIRKIKLIEETILNFEKECKQNINEIVEQLILNWDVLYISQNLKSFKKIENSLILHN